MNSGEKLEKMGKSWKEWRIGVEKCLGVAICGKGWNSGEKCGKVGKGRESA